jgi:hypothetical protein
MFPYKLGEEDRKETRMKSKRKKRRKGFFHNSIETAQEYFFFN